MNVNVARMNFESLKAQINCSRRLFKSTFIAWMDLSAILPIRFGKSLILVKSHHFDFCMQRQRFIIHSLRFLGFFHELSLCHPAFIALLLALLKRDGEHPVFELVPVPSDHTRSTVFNSQGRDSRKNMTGDPKVSGYHFWKLCMVLTCHI